MDVIVGPSRRQSAKELKLLNCGAGDDSWKSPGLHWTAYSLEGLMLKLKLQYFGHLMQRADSLEKTLTLGDWRQKQKRGTEDEIVGWHHRVNGHELGQTLGYGEGQGGLACYSTWGHKESDMAWWLNNKKWFKLILISYFTDEDTEVQKNEIDYQRLVSHPCLYGSRIEKIELRVVSWQHLKCQDNLFPL